MKKTGRVVALLASGLLILGMWGCNGGTGDQEAPPPQQQRDGAPPAGGGYGAPPGGGGYGR